MGEVYLAQDTKLRRKIALKLLPVRFTQDAERVRRFEREARAASALNHPNILTIHEIGEVQTEAGDLHFIATEFVEGQTLRQWMMDWVMGERVKLTDALEVAIQVAGALNAAHTAGIIHRDIKPANIMLRPDGLVKVLDFGLAKLTEQHAGAVDTQAPTIAGSSTTEQGVVMGTIAYMSPEQARGQEVDARTDIFSLGVVIYEMLAGRSPFEGATPSDVMAAILTAEPAPLSEHFPEAPAELERIVSKALRKDREERYQTVNDLLADLKELKREEEKRSEEGQPRPAGIARQPAGASASTLLRWRERRTILAASVALVGLSVAFAYFWLFGQTKRPVMAMPRTIAVLPFKPLVAKERDEMMELGMADTLITKLGGLRQLIVRPTTAVRKYTALDQDPLAAGREQRVDAVLEASYHWTGERVRVTVRLMDVRDGASLWDYKCDEYCNDVFRAQDIISEKVTGALALKLTEEERKLLRKHYTENNEAYRLYLRGKYHLYRRTVPDNVKAAEYFQQAIDMDANYAAAYAGLADAYTSITLQGGRPPKDVLPKAKEALMRALEIDDLLAQAHFSMALFKGTDLDWSGAEKAYQRALELKPGDAATHAWYSVFLAALGRFDQALAECNRALEIEPLSSFANKNVGQILYQARRYDEAIEACNKAIELDPHFGTTYTWLAWSYEQKGLYDQSIEAIAKAYRYPPEIAAALKEAYVKSGWKGYWRKRLELAQERAKGGFVQPSGFAAIYARLGENDQAIEWLEKAYEERDSWLFSLKEHPEWDSLRSDPRFKDLLRRLRLAP